MDYVRSLHVVDSHGKLQTPGGETLYEWKETLFSKEDGSRIVLGAKTTGELVVIKVLPLSEKRNPWWEAGALQKASGIESVAPLLECLQDEGHLYLVMPYYEKGDLFALVSGKKLPEEQARYYLGQMVEILIRLKYDTQIAHHDISLENFMRDGDDNLVLIDFGICVCETETTNPFLYYGKPCYIAPEVVYHKKIGDLYAADVWSLGVCFYSMLTSVLLYENPSSHAYKQLEKGNTRSLLTKDTSLSTEAVWLLCRMLHPEPSQRPSLEEMYWLVDRENNHNVYWFQDLFRRSSRTTRQSERMCVVC